MDERYMKRCVGAFDPSTDLPSCLNVPRIEVSMIARINSGLGEVWVKACPYHTYRVIKYALANTERAGVTRVREILRAPNGQPIRRA